MIDNNLLLLIANRIDEFFLFFCQLCFPLLHHSISEYFISTLCGRESLFSLKLLLVPILDSLLDLLYFRLSMFLTVSFHCNLLFLLYGSRQDFNIIHPLLLMQLKLLFLFPLDILELRKDHFIVKIFATFLNIRDFLTTNHLNFALFKLLEHIVRTYLT